MRPAYDLVIVGGGAAGSEAAMSVADGGRTSILLVEAHHFGGTCTNHGCVPTKALVKSARVAQVMRTANQYGIQPAEPRFEWGDVLRRAYRVRDEMLREGVTPFTKAGVDVEYPAQAMLVGEQRLEVGGTTIEAKAVLLATGLEPFIPPIPGLVEAGYLDNESALEVRELPRRMAVLGGGPIGCEFAQIFARFGVRVTIVEAEQQLLPPEEPESGAAAREAFEAEGIEVRLGAKVSAVSRSGSRRTLEFEAGPPLEVDEILVAVGRCLDGSWHDLDAAGIEWDKKGIKVDRHLRTNKPWAYAAGDVTGGLLFTHTASAMGPIAARNALAGEGTEVYEPRIVPRVTFTDPEVASVGITEQEAREAGHSVRIGVAHVRDAEKAQIDGQTIGQVKVVAADDGQLLGCHIVCETAGDMIHEAVAIMAARSPI
ncbi:MAG: FAD-dependent oxidoreductase, partial [Candidatus Dormibacteraeota bacterium]|nr:FAD-dependent oxidoreductase [Candidatus Dormibacteraeota bacterium]